MSDFLSQEEIDALLGGGKKETVVETKREKPFDFSKIEKIKKGGFPGLEVIFERWAKIFREEIRSLFPVINMVSKNIITVMKFGDFINKIPLPASYTIFTMKPLNESALLVIDSRVVFNLVSALFGGGARPFKIEGRDFTKLEINIINDFVDTVLSSFEKIWHTVFPVEIEKKSIEFNPFLVRIVSPAEKVIVVEMILDIEGLEVPFSFAFPQMLFLPLKDIIFSETSGLEISPEWEENIQKKISKVELTLTLELSRFTMLVEELINLEVGSDIILDVKKDDIIKLLVAGKPKFLAKLGRYDKKYAAMIVSRIKGEEDGREGK
ncbi:flagellar motor switch protein FliM [Sulfurihydrogenibium subterraneum]|uniref:flagellar motor switch protein FliM n=1 Tax=Sulfurihydrogenibium subterraneum TaxID=171121 RepID=UPI00048AC218|nr:FliM/FliN family flagellar motor switch protein [Sulfurihydrogenibium subterraneum]